MDTAASALWNSLETTVKKVRMSNFVCVLL